VMDSNHIPPKYYEKYLEKDESEKNDES